jgi:hypothetical protein
MMLWCSWAMVCLLGCRLGDDCRRGLTLMIRTGG